MSYPAFPADALEKSDYDLGVMLMDIFIQSQAVADGIPIDQIPYTYADGILQKLLLHDTDNAKITSLEKVLQKAALADFDGAGRLCRSLMNDGADRKLKEDLAKLGDKFSKGRKEGTPGPIRKEIAKILKKSPYLKTPEIWTVLSAHPPKGYAFCDNPVGKYIEEIKSGQTVMEYRRFENVCSEEKKK